MPQTALHPEARVEAALAIELISEEDAKFMREFEAEVLEMLTVDDFPYETFATDKSTLIDHNAKDVDQSTTTSDAPSSEASTSVK